MKCVCVVCVLCVCVFFSDFGSFLCCWLATWSLRKHLVSRFWLRTTAVWRTRRGAPLDFAGYSRLWGAAVAGRKWNAIFTHLPEEKRSGNVQLSFLLLSHFVQTPNFDRFRPLQHLLSRGAHRRPLLRTWHLAMANLTRITAAADETLWVTTSALCKARTSRRCKRSVSKIYVALGFCIPIKQASWWILSPGYIVIRTKYG